MALEAQPALLKCACNLLKVIGPTKVCLKCACNHPWTIPIGWERNDFFMSSKRYPCMSLQGGSAWIPTPLPCFGACGSFTAGVWWLQPGSGSMRMSYHYWERFAAVKAGVWTISFCFFPFSSKIAVCIIHQRPHCLRAPNFWLCCSVHKLLSRIKFDAQS